MARFVSKGDVENVKQRRAEDITVAESRLVIQARRLVDRHFDYEDDVITVFNDVENFDEISFKFFVAECERAINATLSHLTYDVRYEVVKFDWKGTQSVLFEESDRDFFKAVKAYIQNMYGVDTDFSTYFDVDSEGLPSQELAFNDFVQDFFVVVFYVHCDGYLDGTGDVPEHDIIFNALPIVYAGSN